MESARKLSDFPLEELQKKIRFIGLVFILTIIGSIALAWFLVDIYLRTGDWLILLPAVAAIFGPFPMWLVWRQFKSEIRSRQGF